MTHVGQSRSLGGVSRLLRPGTSPQARRPYMLETYEVGNWSGVNIVGYKSSDADLRLPHEPRGGSRPLIRKLWPRLTERSTASTRCRWTSSRHVGTSLPSA